MIGQCLEQTYFRNEKDSKQKRVKNGRGADFVWKSGVPILPNPGTWWMTLSTALCWRKGRKWMLLAISTVQWFDRNSREIGSYYWRQGSRNKRLYVIQCEWVLSPWKKVYRFIHHHEKDTSCSCHPIHCGDRSEGIFVISKVLSWISHTIGS